MKDINELNLEVERIRGDIKLIQQSVDTIKDNHLVHLEKKVSGINRVLWTVGILIFTQLVLTIKTLLI
jgi:hypothetical protein|tara:strand:- start:187 stop:390 length:204 start_codon:yes stop_codon:yes gene_type:complete